MASVAVVRLMFGGNGLGFIKLPFYCFLSFCCMCCVVCSWASLPELNKWMDGYIIYLPNKSATLMQYLLLVTELRIYYMSEMCK